MPSWGGILHEVNDLAAKDPQHALDFVRRKYLASLHAHTKRAVILYATKWTQPSDNVPPDMVSINDGDIQGLMEVVHGVDDQNLDLIIHSPGGYITAADAFVQYLRSKFSNIRVIVPQAAMSAATMIACAADEIVMGKHSSLGPIDPQFSMHTSLGVRMIPAQAILDQFERAKEECKDPAKLAAWVPMLQQFGPDLLVQCTNMSVLAFQLVREWLATYMFKDQADRDAKAISVAGWLVNHGEFKTHSRHINRSILLERGLKITNLEDDKFVQDFALSIFHAATITFTHSGAVKIIENHKGNAFLQQVQPVFVEQPAQVRFSPPAVANPNLRPPPFQKKKH